MALYRGMWWNSHRVPSRSMEKRPKFWTLLSILGNWGDVAGFKWMKGSRRRPFWHIIKIIISYLINAQLNQVLTWKFTLFGESPRNRLVKPSFINSEFPTIIAGVSFYNHSLVCYSLSFWKILFTLFEYFKKSDVFSLTNDEETNFSKSFTLDVNI